MEVWNNQLLVADGNWKDVEKAAQSVRKALIQRLVENRAVPIERGISYWRSVGICSVPRASLLYLQQSPLWIFRSILHFSNIKDNFRVPQLISFKGIYPHLALDLNGVVPKNANIFQTISYSLNHFAMSIVIQFRNIKNVFVSLAKRISNEKLDELTKVQNETAEKIGDLLIASEESDVQQLIGKMAHSVLGSEMSPPKTTNEALEVLQALLSFQSNDIGLHGSKLDDTICAVDTFPTRLTRYWPLFAILAVGGWKLTGSWSDLMLWFDVNVVNTLQLFYKNWLVDPLLQIYKTIRHDESSQVALVAKESLSSDISSLERMVVDFARDTDPQLSAEELRKIGVAASRGNVTPVMSVYEKQLSSPITSAITGKLIRTLLIQVQKGKVDLEVALSGIDQLLQSQQLVFGLVAAFPAIITIFWLAKISTSGIWSSAMRKGQVRHSIIADMLLVLDRTIQDAPAKLRSSDIGLIYSCVYLIRAEFFGHHSLRQTRLLEQLDRLENNAITKRDAGIVLADLDRAYSRYYI